MAFKFGNTVVTDGLKLYLDAGNARSYPGSGNTWYDISNNSNNFTLYNSPTFDGQALTFNVNGSNQYAQCINSTCCNFGTGSFTLEYIFNLATAVGASTATGLFSTVFIKRGVSTNINTPSYPGITFNPGGNNPGFGIGYYSGFAAWTDEAGVPNDGNHRIDYQPLPSTPNNYIPENTNIHVVHTIQRNGLQMTGSWYSNGTYKSKIQHLCLGTGNYNNNSPVQLMKSYNVTNNLRSGSLCIVRAYDRALSQAEITQNYNALKWRFNI